MGLISKVKSLFQFASLYRKVKEEYMTKGMKSSEFWLTLIASITTMFQAIQGNIDPKLATIIGAVLTAVYTIARALVKSSETGEAK